MRKNKDARIAELEMVLMELTYAASEVFFARNLDELGDVRLGGAIKDAAAALPSVLRPPTRYVTAARLEAALRDAERYRWLRTAGAWDSEIGLNILSERPDDFDAAVDAAMYFRA